MARSSKPRKAYRPRPVAQWIDREERQKIETCAHLMATKLGRGLFDEIDSNTAAYVLNVARRLGHMNGREDVVEAADRGQIALETVRERHRRLGRYGASGEELAALSDVLGPLAEYFASQPAHRIAEARQWVVRANEELKARGLTYGEVAT